ncbi:MAG TPA: DUF4178 domain-containing protein [Longimicrobium sp.]|jgi:hypothetical protein|uniref:DUF4178 domain-containing protein n=1 Tax=Longimicrobium sp. TaxID=2029185 RepID=UPI002ED916B9
MNATVANCPSCGAAVAFQSAAAVQTVCASCKSVLVRHDLDLEKVGVESLPPPVTSRIRIGTTGSYKWARFAVVGRIAYRWENGAWSEWHLSFADGRTGWLSDAQDEYAVTFAEAESGAIPPAEALRPGEVVLLGARQTGWTVGAVTRAAYAGTEGELPFTTTDRAESVFVDLRSGEGGLATVDYSGAEPVLYTGEFVPLESLQLKELADPAERRVEGAATLNCPHCGGTVALRLPGQSVNAVCEYCQSVLDVTNSRQLRVLQRFEERRKVPPRIPLGARGMLHDAEWEVLGFQQRTITVEGTEYSWREYLLHNADRGFRYLSEYAGHWNDIEVLTAVPQPLTRGVVRGGKMRHGTQTFRHFQHARAETTFVLGEFPWQVRAGDKAEVDDFVAPPLLLSREKTGQEVTWSLGEYTAPETIYKAFGVADRPPAPRGVFANQPPPPGSGRMWRLALLFAALVACGWIFRLANANRPVLRERGEYRAGAPAPGATPLDSATAEERPLVSEPFQLGGRTTNLHVKLTAAIDNSWTAFGVLLVPEGTTRDAREFTGEVSYYHGVDGGESWSEGSQTTRIRIASVPPGRYRLVLAPDGPTAFTYRVEVRRDVPAGSLYLVAMLLLLIPPIFPALRRASFEGQRWAESDYAPASED